MELAVLLIEGQKFSGGDAEIGAVERQPAAGFQRRDIRKGPQIREAQFNGFLRQSLRPIDQRLSRTPELFRGRGQQLEFVKVAWPHLVSLGSSDRCNTG